MFRRLFFLRFLVLVFAISIVTSTLSAIPAFADTTITNPENDAAKQAEGFIRFTALMGCYGLHDVGKTSKSNVEAGNWFKAKLSSDARTNIGYLSGSDNQSCGDGGFVTDSNTFLGFDSNMDAFCSIQPIAKSNGGESKEACMQGSKDWDLSGNLGDQTSDFSAAVSSSYKTLPDYAKYILYKKSLEKFCGGGATLTAENSSTVDGGNAVTVSYVDPTTGKISDVIYKYAGGKDDGSNIPDLWLGHDGGECGDFAKGKKNSMAALAAAYAAYVKKSAISQVEDNILTSSKAAVDAYIKDKCGTKPTGSPNHGPGLAWQECSDAISNAIGAAVTSCTNSVTPSADPNKTQADIIKCAIAKLPDDMKNIFDKVSPVEVEQTSTTDGATDDTTSCQVDGIGWIICPTIKFIGKVNDAAYSFLSDTFLQIEPQLLTGDDSGNPTKDAWASFRDIANVLFVIAFLIIVYSQMTGTGVTNYGIKKMLPRLIIAAILVNVSYYVCEIAVDLSNIVGKDAVALFNGIDTGEGGAAPSGVNAIWNATAITVLATGTILAIVVLIILAPSVLLVFALVVLILIARKALIILLIVVSPLAFVAYLLPNTDQWFKKWWKMFSTLLLVFPVIGVLFGAGSMASKILLKVAGNDGQMMAIVALGVQAVPLFALPALLKGSMSAAGTLGAKLSGYADKAGKNAVGKSRLGAMKTQYDRNRDVKRSQRWGGRGSKYDPRTIVNRGVNKATGTYGQRIAAAGAETESKIANEDVDRAAILMQKQDGWNAATTIPKAQGELAEAIKKGDTTKARAAQKILLGSGSKGVEALGQTLDKSVTTANKDGGTVQYLKSDITGAGLKGKDAALDKWSRETEINDAGKRVATSASISTLASRTGSLDALSDHELAGQSVTRLAQSSISPVRANEIMGNNEVWGNLAEDKKQAIRDNVAGLRNESKEEAHGQAIVEDTHRTPPGP